MNKKITDQIKSFIEKNRQDNEQIFTGWHLRVREIYIYFQHLNTSDKHT